VELVELALDHHCCVALWQLLGVMVERGLGLEIMQVAEQRVLFMELADLAVLRQVVLHIRVVAA
jgi:hypothetical protein